GACDRGLLDRLEPQAAAPAAALVLPPLLRGRRHRSRRRDDRLGPGLRLGRADPRRAREPAHLAELALESLQPALEVVDAREELVGAHDASPRGRSSTASSQSSASAILSSVSIRGGLPPVSSRAIADCVV